MPKPHYTSLLASPRGGLVILTRAALNCFIQFCAFPPSYSPHPTRRSAAHALFQLVSLVAAITPSKLLFWHPSKLVFPSPCVCGTQRRPCPLSSIFRGPGVVPRTLRAPPAMRSAVLARFFESPQSSSRYSRAAPQLLNGPFTVPPSHRRVAPPSHIYSIFGVAAVTFAISRPVCNAPYRHRNPSSALPVNVRAVRCPSPELLNSPFTLPPSHRRVAQPPRAVACSAAPEVLHGLFAVPTDPLRYPRTFFFRFFAFPLSPSRGSSAETRSILRWLGARLWCTSSLRSYRCLSLAPVSPSTSSLLFLRSCRIPDALAACSAAQAVPHSPITFPMRAAALELFLGVWRPREAGLAFPRCVGGAQHRSRRSHSSPTSRRALHPPRPAFRFLEFSPSTSPHPQRFYSMSRWRCAPLNRVRVPVVVRDVTNGAQRRPLSFYSIFRLPTPGSFASPPLFLFYFSPSRSQLPNVAMSRRRCAPLNRVRVPALPRDVATAPVFFFDFSRLLSVAMPWRCAAPLTAPPCSFLFDFPPPHHRLLCVSMPRRHAAPYTCRLRRGAPPSFLPIPFFASPRPAFQCLDVSAAHTALQSRPSLRALARRPRCAALAFFNRFFPAPAAALPLDILGGPQRPCTRARLSALQRDVINAVQARIPTCIYTHQLCRLAIIGFFFRSAAPVHLHDLHALPVPNSCASPPTRFRKFSPLAQFSVFFSSLRGLGSRFCMAPVLRVSKPNALQPTNLGMRSALVH
ncbi:hypothetical protein C8J57DRAFT_1569890 [Mycena rebaudengoi]|nr:hypothetical protein C8J57DRAFT_1569890 [Mycena rebaudengoi]